MSLSLGSLPTVRVIRDVHTEIEFRSGRNSPKNRNIGYRYISISLSLGDGGGEEEWHWHCAWISRFSGEKTESVQVLKGKRRRRREDSLGDQETSQPCFCVFTIDLSKMAKILYV